MTLNYYIARTPQEVTDFVNKGNKQVVSIVKDGEYLTIFYWME